MKYLWRPSATRRCYDFRDQYLIPISRKKTCRCFTFTTTRSLHLEDPRWLHDTRGRIGRCISFGLEPALVNEAGKILKELAVNWRALLAGTEGFLTSYERGGLLKHRVVWGDLDSMGHVNNVVYNKWAESGRIEWVLNFARTFNIDHAQYWRELWTPRGDGMILRSIKTDFKFPISYPDRVSVFHKLAAPVKEGDSSFTLEVLMLSERHQRIAARCLEDIVLYDYPAASKIPLSRRPFVLKAFEDLFEAQLRESEGCLRRRHALSQVVRQIEIGSWDREDAKEDLGGVAKP